MKYKQTALLAVLMVLLACNSNTTLPDSQQKVDTLNQHDDAILQSSQCKVFGNDKVKSRFFPFEFKHFEPERIKSYFVEGIEMDSLVKHKDETWGHTIYRFKTARSWVEFMVKKEQSDEEYFYLMGGKVEDQLLRKEYFPMGMTKDQLKTKLGVKTGNCDTVEVEEGELSSYYCFIFKDDTLKGISISVTE